MTTDRTEDYLEAIYTVVRKKGYAKVKDISTILSVAPASVTEMFGKLGDDGLVNYEKYSGVTLTEKGTRIAKDTRERHNTIRELLMILGVEESIADVDACRIEHSVNEETMERLSNFVQFVKKTKDSPRWLDHFKYYHDEGEFIECSPATARDCPVHGGAPGKKGKKGAKAGAKKGGKKGGKKK